jgi:mono/diheme cytochrome c family protein
MLIYMIALLFAAMPSKAPTDIKKGEKLYQELCWQCHGKRALGDGPLAGSLSTKPPPLAGRYKQSQFSGAVKTIQEGKGSMPAYEQLIDKHDSRRVMVWLSALDSQTGRQKKRTPAPKEEKPKSEKK